MSEKLDVIIIGAGLAGLSAALHLNAKGKSIKIFESKGHIGGRVFSEFKEGFCLDRGFQVLMTAYPECKQLLDYDRLQLKNFDKGALIAQKKELIRLNYSNSLSSIYELLSSPIFTKKDLWHLFLLSRKLHRSSGERLLREDSLNALTCLEKEGFSRLSIESFFKPFLGGVLLDRSLLSSGNMVNFVLKMFMEGDVALPAKGMGAIPQQIAEQLPPGTIHLNRKAVHITPEREVLLQGGQRVSAETVILATDPWSAAKLIDLPLPAPGHSVACCYFAADKPPFSEAMLFLNGEEKGPINHIAVVSNVAPSYAPSGGHLISATILEKYMHLNDEGLNNAAIEQLNQWFGSQVFQWQPLQTYRIQNAHPAIYPDRFWHSPYPFKIRKGLYACGDYLEAPSINSALATGRKVAAEILK